MNPAIQTNKNGIDTLTKRHHALKLRFFDLEAKLDAMDLEPLATSQVETARQARINSQRIAAIRESDYQTQIDDLLVVTKGLDNRVSALEQQNVLLQKANEDQKHRISELEHKIDQNTEIILENAEELAAVEDVIEDSITKIDKALGSVHDVSINLSLLRNKLENDGKIIDGCIIGIDKNTTAIKETNKNVELTAVTVLSNVESNKKLIQVAKNLNNAIDLVRVQVQTNATNIRKK